MKVNIKYFCLGVVTVACAGLYFYPFFVLSALFLVFYRSYFILFLAVMFDLINMILHFVYFDKFLFFISPVLLVLFVFFDMIRKKLLII